MRHVNFSTMTRIFLPNAGPALQQIFAQGQWDLALTYFKQGYQTKMGSTLNTGIMFFRSISNSTISFLEMVRERMPTHAGGGVNQVTIGRFVPHLKYRQIYKLDLHKLKHSNVDGQLRILALQCPGPFNYDSNHDYDQGCCELPPDIYVVHLNYLKKNFALSSCCRDSAFPLTTTSNRRYLAYRGYWKESCECRMTSPDVTSSSARVSCSPSPNATQNFTSWCET